MFVDCTYIHVGSNLGFGKAHNLAIMDMGNNSFAHVVLNADVLFDPLVIGALVHRLEIDPSIVQLMPQVLDFSGSSQMLTKLLPTPLDFIVRFLPGVRGSRLTRKLESRFTLSSFEIVSELDLYYLSGCFMVLRTSAAKSLGGFDPRFFLHYEDLDLTRRMSGVGRTVYVPQVQIHHRHAKEAYKSFKVFWIQLVSMIRYFSKWGWIRDADRATKNKRVLEEVRERFTRRPGVGYF